MDAESSGENLMETSYLQSPKTPLLITEEKMITLEWINQVYTKNTEKNTSSIPFVVISCQKCFTSI